MDSNTPQPILMQVRTVVERPVDDPPHNNPWRNNRLSCDGLPFVLVSTVRLPYNYMTNGEGLYETGVFPIWEHDADGEPIIDHDALDMVRCDSLEEAIAQHQRAVEKWHKADGSIDIDEDLDKPLGGDWVDDGSEDASDRDPETGIQYGDLN